MYCTPQRGYAVGKTGASYRRTCPPESEPAFLEGYDAGKGIHGEQRRASDIERQIRDAEKKLKAAEAADERDTLRRKIRDLDEVEEPGSAPRAAPAGRGSGSGVRLALHRRDGVWERLSIAC
jgi:hypothetical protein